MLLLGQDLPHGNYAALRRAGSLAPSNTGREYLVAVRNYRTWVLTALYAFNFGVELTMNNGERGVMACAAVNLMARLGTKCHSSRCGWPRPCDVQRIGDLHGWGMVLVAGADLLPCPGKQRQRLPLIWLPPPPPVQCLPNTFTTPLTHP